MIFRSISQPTPAWHKKAPEGAGLGLLDLEALLVEEVRDSILRPIVEGFDLLVRGVAFRAPVGNGAFHLIDLVAETSRVGQVVQSDTSEAVCHLVADLASDLPRGQVWVGEEGSELRVFGWVAHWEDTQTDRCWAEIEKNRCLILRS